MFNLMVLALTVLLARAHAIAASHPDSPAAMFLYRCQLAVRNVWWVVTTPYRAFGRVTGMVHRLATLVVTVLLGHPLRAAVTFTVAGLFISLMHQEVSAIQRVASAASFHRGHVLFSTPNLQLDVEAAEDARDHVNERSAFAAAVGAVAPRFSKPARCWLCWMREAQELCAVAPIPREESK